MTILAIETSCDETSAAVVKNYGAIARIRSNIVASQVKLHAKTGGVVPEVAAREHIRPIIPTIEGTLHHAKIRLMDIDVIAVTVGPGLHTALSVGLETAKALSYSLGLPLIPVNHLRGHIAANWNNRSPKLPALCLIVSGGHTELVLIDRHRHIKLLGATRDDAAGEAFDKVAQLLGLGYPGGPAISALAARGNPHAFDLPRPMLEHKNLDFSFSGLKTAVRYLVDKHPLLTKEGKPRQQRAGVVADTCASFQQAIVDVLVAKTMRAARQHRPKEVLLAGGVAANTELRRRLAGEVKKLAWKPSYRQPPPELCTDNAGMIGLAAAYFPHTTKQTVWKTLDIQPSLSI
ncbi:MAG: tRNA (adenosine(37)-N6)-threonylcarbamoyltransferase complex transferase subunit TsaD [Candidatus Kerfeldbacteria bacterium]|nr:tRNA (adenosine(37)-N6)-threonylcarbamoyltransferase complex transferase subunit TsaD [Candidatus Kerfeldbacteria bacterium]